MKRIFLSAAILVAISGPAFASGGFSCESGEKDPVKFVVEGATPRSGGGLINFGAVLEIEGKKIEFKQSDVKRYYGVGGVIQVRMSARSGGQNFTVNVNAKRNPKDEDDWAGTYEVSYAPPAAKDKAKLKAVTKRGSVKCFVE